MASSEHTPWYVQQQEPEKEEIDELALCVSTEDHLIFPGVKCTRFLFRVGDLHITVDGLRFFHSGDRAGALVAGTTGLLTLMPNVFNPDLFRWSLWRYLWVLAVVLSAIYLLMSPLKRIHERRVREMRRGIREQSPEKYQSKSKHSFFLEAESIDCLEVKKKAFTVRTTRRDYRRVVVENLKREQISALHAFVDTQGWKVK